MDPSVHEGVLAAAAEADMSVSAWMTEAARNALRIRDGLQAVAEWESENGVFTPEEIEASERRVDAEIRTAQSRRTA